jgi:CheY-like chemotaxis protein
MDVSMPVMDGLEATRRIRALGAASLIIAVTGHEDAGMAARCARAGMDAALAKPLALDRLCEALTPCAPGAALDAPRRV